MPFEKAVVKVVSLQAKNCIPFGIRVRIIFSEVIHKNLVTVSFPIGDLGPKC